jgi:transposase InsO family protein
MKKEHSVLLLCEVFSVSHSGYYDWIKRGNSPGPRQVQNEALAQQIKAIHAQSRETYGSPRIAAQLRQEGSKHGRNRISRIMKQEGLCGRQKRRYRVQTTDSDHDQPIAPNRLADLPPPVRPNQIWVGDITYIPTQEGWLYLAAILDLYSRKIVGWSMGPFIDTALVLRALQMALLHQKPPTDLIFHSDRGVQYASKEYRHALTRSGLIASMSRKANCYDNATMESFWSTLKLEAIYRRDPLNQAQTRAEIFDYIETFYNRKRMHSALDYLSPVDFEAQNN